MKKLLLAGVALAAIAAAGSAGAADLAPVYKAPMPYWSWTGFYVGTHSGAAMGLNKIADPLGPSIFGDWIHSPGPLGGGQIGYDWQAPHSNWVFGVEADASLANLDGTNTCYAFSGTFTSFNCRTHTTAFGTATARLGWAFGPEGRSLAYVKGGFAWAHSTVDVIINANPFGVAGFASTAFTSGGGTVGAGLEHAITPHWTVKAEYDYMNLGSTSVAAPTPSVNSIGGLVAVPGTTVAQQIHVFKLGMNYKLGAGGGSFDDIHGAWAADYPVKAPMMYKAPVPSWAPGWAVEGGARYWFSSGRFQKDIANGNFGDMNPTQNVSRLTWDNLTGHSGELFARVDSPWNFFVKGFAGGGGITNGKINDEDWIGLYSNTLGNASGTLAYGTVDIGYDIFRGPGYKVGAFMGYNTYTDNKSSFTCSQIGSLATGICSPPINGFILGENDRWQSLRVGSSAEVMLDPHWKLVADAAWVPYTRFTGQDFHPLRPFLAEEWGNGMGAQVEAILSYYVTPQFSIGAGGRYWAMWTINGADCREPPNGACPAPLQNMQFKTERFGMLFQAAYRFGD
jgi:opacity protein-like surface antigen